MIERLFTCFGNVGEMGFRSAASMDITIEDYDHFDDVAPILIHVSGALANYIHDIEGTDAEERYIPSIWKYDRNLELYCIEIPSSDPNNPAKIIINPTHLPSGNRQTPADQPIIFGPADYIEEPHPDPMSQEEQRRYFQWRKDTFYPDPPAKESAPVQQNGNVPK